MLVVADAEDDLLQFRPCADTEPQLRHRTDRGERRTGLSTRAPNPKGHTTHG